jgi:protein SCO1
MRAWLAGILFLEIALVSSGAFILGVAIWWTAPWQEDRTAIGGAFEMSTSRGDVLTEQSLRGRPFIVFFGFTHCPDICPTTLFQISQATKLADKRAQEMPILFATIDPARDTPEILDTYLRSFAPNIVGLSGTPEKTQIMLSNYRAFARRVETANGWTFDHSSMVYQMDAKGRFFGPLNVDLPTPLLSKALDAHALR